MRERIELRGDNPLESGDRRDSLQSLSGCEPGFQRWATAQAAVEHYRLNLATVHAALAFYEVAEILRRDDLSVGENGLVCRMLPIGRHTRNVLDGFH